MKITFFFSLLLIPNILKAQWDGNPLSVNNPVSVSDSLDLISYPITDGNGGVILFWVKTIGADTVIVAQRKAANGKILWNNSASPKIICSVRGEKQITDATPDGNGGAYISWVNNESAYYMQTPADLFVQHIDGNGNILWASQGIKVNNNTGQLNYQANLVVSNNKLIVGWSSGVLNSSNYFDTTLVYMQQINSDGSKNWNPNGVRVCLNSASQQSSLLLEDGNGGAFVVFNDYRTARNNGFNVWNQNIYSQHISSGGQRLWADTGAIVTNESGSQLLTDVYLSTQFNIEKQPKCILKHANDGFYVAFENYATNIYNTKGLVNVQCMNNLGTRMFGDYGIRLSNIDTAYMALLSCLSDEKGGVVVVWEQSKRSDFGSLEIAAQRIDSVGIILWQQNGIKIMGPQNLFDRADITSNHAGSFIATWVYRESDFLSGIVKAQVADTAGLIHGPYAGIDICTNTSFWPYVSAVVNSDVSSSIICWENRLFNDYYGADIYAAKLNINGSLIKSYTTIASGDWNNPATWGGGVVPPNNTEVVIRNQVNLSTNISLSSLLIESPGNLILAPGVNATLLH
jgi:hypothetical protein